MPTDVQPSRGLRSVFRSLPLSLVGGLVLLLAALLAAHNTLMQLEIRQARENAVQRLGAYETSLLASVDRHLYLPQILASDPRIVGALASRPEDDRAASERQPTSKLLQRINRQAGSDQIFLMSPDGMTHWSSNYDTETSFVGSNYSFRPYFRDAMAGSAGLYFAVGATSGIPGLFLSAPVTSSEDRTLGVIVVKIDLRPLEQSWETSGDAVWVTDEKGIVFLASSARWHYAGTQPLSVAHKTQLSETLQYGAGPLQSLSRATRWQSEDWSTYDLGDQGHQVAFGAAVSGYPWRMHLRVPLQSIETGVRLKQSLAVLLYAGLAGALLFYRERRRRTDAQQAITRLVTEREHHQRAIIQNTDAGLLNLDAGFEPLFINEQARNLFRLGDAGFHDPASLIQPWEPDAAGKGPCRAEGLRSDGSRFPIIYTLNPIRVGEQDEFILTVQDTTELTATQRALQDANQALEQRVEERTRDLKQAQAALAQNQKLAALGRMSSAIAHEINQPITALSNYVASSRVLLERNRNEAVGSNLVKIEGLVERLSKLSRQLRIFSGKRNTGSSRVSLQAPVHYALELLAPRLEAQRIECKLDLGRDLEVQANAMMLEQIVVNLVANAIDALDGQPDAHIDIQLSEPQSAPGAVLSITDNGPGMPEDQLVHVFEPFFTTKAVGEGMGLGLAISYSLARDMGAELTVTSRVGEGTGFNLVFTEASRVTEQLDIANPAGD